MSRKATTKKAAPAARARTPRPSKRRPAAKAKAKSPARTAARNGTPIKAKVHVTLKPGVLDPQGKAIHNALVGLGFRGIGDVRQGKYIEIALAEKDRAKARAHVENMCRKLLANTVIENYSIEIGN